MATEKFIVATKQWSLGFLKETVYRGNVLEVDREKGVLSIDGRPFNDVRDVDIAKRQAERFPENPLIVPFTDANLQRIKGQPAPIVKTKPKPGENMPVVQSDEDTHETIDIAATQVSRKNREAKEAERTKAKVEKLPVVKGDETPEERVERIRAEKLNEKIPIVRDDSLGYEGGSKAAALNAGQKLPSLAEVKAKDDLARQTAEARKKLAEAKRTVPVPVTSTKEGAAELQELIGADEKSVAASPAPVVETETASTAAPVEVPESPSRLDSLEQQVFALSEAVGSLLKVLNPDSKRVPVKRGRKAKAATEPTA